MPGWIPNAAEFLLRPSPRIKSAQEQHTARLFAGMILVHFMVAGICLLLSQVYFSRALGLHIWNDPDTKIILASIVLLIPCYLLLRFGRLSTAIPAYIALTTLVPLIAPFVNHPRAEIGLLALAMIPVFLCSLAYSQRWGLALTGLIAVLGLLRILYSPITDQDKSTGFVILVVVVLTGLLVNYFRGYFSSMEARRLEAIRLSESKYRQLFETVTDGIFIADSDQKVVEANSAACRQLGRTHEELMGLPLHRISARKPEAVSKLLASLEEGRVRMIETRHRRKDGSQISIELAVTRINYLGQTAYLGVARDVTERREAQQQITQERLLTEAIFESAPGMLYLFNSERRLVRWNRQIEEVSGVPAEKLFGIHALDPIHPDDRNKATAAIDEVFARGSSSVVVRVRMADGQFIPYLASGIKMEIDGELYFTGIGIDISKRLEAERRLLDSEERYRLLAETAQELICVIDLEGRIVYANRKALEITGYTDAEAAEMRLEHLAPRDELGKWQQMLALHRRGFKDPVHFSTGILAKDGRRLTMDVSNVPILQDGEITGILNVARDATERLKTEKIEAQLQHLQKMEAIGTLAGGIAHDFNNILSAIIANAELAQDQVQASTDAADCLSQILLASERARALVKQILAFSRHSESANVVIDPSTIVKEVVKLLRPALPATIDLRVDTGSVHSSIETDAAEFHQVLMNLCSNAAHALPNDTGSIEIRLADVLVDSDFAETKPRLTPGLYVRLSVSDTGIGMIPEVLDRIFEPFFTTKEPGEGTGMGLSVIHGIVDRMHGAIDVYSEPGQGTTFNVFLPAVADHTREETGTPGDAQEKHSGRLMVVDDESTIVRSLTRILEKQGYRIDGFTRGTDALEWFRRDPDQVDLVITDVTMPRMTGVELARAMLELRPDLPILLCTGFSRTVTAESAQELGIAAFLMKPFSREELQKAISKALGGE